MGNLCIPGELYIEAAGKEDEDREFAFIVDVMLENRLIVPAWVVPTDTMKKLNQKISEMHGERKSEKLMIFRGNRVGFVESEVTIQETRARCFRYPTEIELESEDIKNRLHCFTPEDIQTEETPCAEEEFYNLFYPDVETT